MECGADGGEWICGGDGESARVDGVWAGVYRWGEWRLGREGVCRSDEGAGLCGGRSILFIDKTRECALGASYGGFMADWILTHTDRFACIVTHDGMFNPQSAYGTTEELWFNEWEFRNPGEATPGSRGVTATRPVAKDPFQEVVADAVDQNAKTPTLVVHSQRDYRLDVSEGFQLFTALQRLNVPSKMLYFPDEGHMGVEAAELEALVRDGGGLV